MSDKLKIKIENKGEEVLIQFAGPIDEDSSFEDISKLSSQKIVFDFENVSLINSCGIREWINFIEALDSGISFSYINCRQIIIEQINMVKGFIREGSRVDTFYAPYYCETCDDEYKIHLNHNDIVDSKAPKVSCPKCSKEDIEFDAIEEQFFQFTK